MGGTLESEEGVVGIGAINAGRGGDKPLKAMVTPPKPLKAMVTPSSTGFQQDLNVPLQRRGVNNFAWSKGSSERLRSNGGAIHKPMFRSPLDDSWTAPEVPEWAKPDVNTTYRLAVIKTMMVVVVATLFGIVTWVFKGKQSSMEYAAGYLVEQSLSIDNLFVFIMLFNYFSVPLEHQGRVLLWGIMGAIVMRAFMITLGVTIVKKFRCMFVLFAVILLVSGYKLLQEDDDDHNLSENAVVKLSKKLVGAVDRYDGDKFFTSDLKGRTVATPLFLCLVCIELSDFIFAVDSIPAVLGISQDPFVVYSSNIFAIMSLRSLYSIVAKAVTQLQYLKPAVALVLAFVGLKMILEFLHFDIPTAVSLFVVTGLISGGVISSLVKTWWTRGSVPYKLEKKNIYPPPEDIERDVSERV